ncbi:MAG: hypothetical protein CM15mP22_4640 [Gammaproteobacteria bacterium]|nr:MAG: hypothetical protein CM15mP22_4640 [Gammaproteobacteria bacterium]
MGLEQLVFQMIITKGLIEEGSLINKDQPEINLKVLFLN